MSADVLESLRELHDAIVADLADHYQDRVLTVAAYDPVPDAEGQERVPVVTPAILLELEAIDHGEDDGTDRQPLRLTWVAHCVLSFRTAQLQIELREFATSVLARVRHNRWGFYGAVQEPTALSAQPAEFRPGLDGFEVWIARWEQLVYVGPDVWSGEGILPTEVWLGWSPHIGTAHVDEYVRVDEIEGD